MEFEFDKEIDALLRQSAQNETAFAAANPQSAIRNPQSFHLDADEISAFAENALPEKAKQSYLRHLADCDECRKTLSSLILLNAGQSSEINRAAEKQFVQTPVSWYQKLFAVPNLAYTMGALVLVFSGIALYAVLQNTGNALNSEVSQTFEKQSGGKGMNSDGDALPTESYSSNSAISSNMMSNAASMNSSSNTAATDFVNPAIPSVPMTAANSNVTAMRRESNANSPAEAKSAVPTEPSVLAETQDSVITAAPSPTTPPVKEDNSQVDGESEKRLSQNSIAQKQANELSGAGSLKSAPKPTRADAKSKKLEESEDDARKKSIETTTIGGKTFKRTNNVWYDSAYRGQSTTNVTRGTPDYKKLDAGLRGIAENLGGTVVIIWKEKAYRIQ